MQTNSWNPAARQGARAMPGSRQFVMEKGRKRAEERRGERQVARRGVVDALADTGRARAKLARAESALQHGNLQAAHDAYLEALGLNPNAPVRSQALSGIAQVLILAGNPADAQPLLAEALTLDPVNRQALALTGH